MPSRAGLSSSREDDWIEQLLTVYDHSLATEQNAEQAMGHLVTAILISPHFLLRTEPLDQSMKINRSKSAIWNWLAVELFLVVRAAR